MQEPEKDSLRFRNNAEDQRQNVRALMQAAEIPMDLDAYDAKIYVPIVQDLHD